MKRLGGGGEGRVLTGILKTKWIRCDSQIGCLSRFPWRQHPSVKF